MRNRNRAAGCFLKVHDFQGFLGAGDHVVSTQRQQRAGGGEGEKLAARMRIVHRLSCLL